MNKTDKDAFDAPVGKKAWVKPTATGEPVRKVTRGPNGLGGDMNSCHS